MTDIPANLKYSQSHEWIRSENNQTVILGITEHAQHLLGDLVFIELPQLKQAIKVGEEIGVLESVKAASDLYTPISGEIVAINEKLQDSPELINTDPYGEGWLVKIKLNKQSNLDGLLDAQAYTKLIAEEA